MHEVGIMLRNNERLILEVDTDILLDGRFGTRRLVITDQRLITVSPNGDPNQPDFEIPLERVNSAKAVQLVGQTAFEIEAEGQRHELLRSTNTFSSKFIKIAKALNGWKKDGDELSIDLSEDDDRTCATCGRLLPEPGSFCPGCLKKRMVLARFWGYMKPHWRKALLVSVCIITGTLLGLVPPYLVKYLVDNVLMGSRDVRLLMALIFGLVAVHGVSTLLGILRGRLSAWLGSSVVHSVRFDFYQAVQGLSLRRIDKTQTGALMSRLTNDTSMLNFLFTDIGVIFVPALLQLVGICIMLLVLNWKLALLVLVPTPAVVAITLWFYRRMRRLYHRLWQKRAVMSARANDTISGIRVVKSFVQEPKEVRMFGNRSRDVYHSAAAAESMYATSFPLITLITTLGSVFVWYFGGLSVMRDHLSIGTLMAFLSYLTMFYGPLQMLTRLADFLNRAFTAAQRLFEITDFDQEVRDDKHALELASPKGAFAFEDVHFGYLKDQPVLKGLDFEVLEGEMIGLVGRSGVGKTTITNLICRFYDVEEGRIVLDGTDLRKIKLNDLRNHIGIVPQETFLFNGTICENIAYAKPEATKEEVIHAAIAANAHGFVMRFPDGYDTIVGERGARLSGGEKQRVAIARAILHDPKILILDEATSSVDTETEELIQEALSRLVKDRTTFAIAHRLSTLRNANRLLVIEDGKQSEFGTHDELIEKKGVYYNLVEMQSKLSAIKAVDG